MSFPIKLANTLKLDFGQNNSVYSNNYNDIYFQPTIGLDEKLHVFLKGNNLPNNWQEKDSFTIAETGFGTGLIFLATMQLWKETRKSSQHLNYVSCELHPLNTKQLKRALASFPDIKPYGDVLIEKYPKHLFFGFHRIHFDDINLTLTLIIGDCVDAFSQLQANVDAWYLDGFAPSKNNAMWSEELFKEIANLSHIDTTVSTYTVARDIRNKLQQVGFTINKTKGFGNKREMLTAKMLSENRIKEKQPWAHTFKARKAKTFTVLGAGIAGTTIADKLSILGKDVTVIDRQKQPCLETSGNPQAMIMPSLTLNDSIEARFYLSAFNYAREYYSKYNYHAVGVYEIALTDKQKQWQKVLMSNFDFPKEMVKPYKDGMLYPCAGWLDTQGNAKSVYVNLDNYLQAEITKIAYKDNKWHLYENNKLLHTTDVLILSNGLSILKLLPYYQIPLTPKHGQISYFKSADIDNQIAACPHIQLNKGYITPNWNGVQTIGATYDHMNIELWYKEPQTTINHWQRNIELWQATPYIELLNKATSYKAKAGIRITTPDHMPICGAIINQSLFKKDYHDIRHGKQHKQYPIPSALENLYLMTGLGSRGFTSAPLLAEFLCNQILGHPQAINQQLQQAINPNRFLFKKLKTLN